MFPGILSELTVKLRLFLALPVSARPAALNSDAHSQTRELDGSEPTATPPSMKRIPWVEAMLCAIQ